MPSAPLLTTPAELNHALSTARAAWQAAPYPSWAERRARLAALRAALQGHAGALAAAVSADFGQRSADETRMAELFPTLLAIDHARRHLRRWMRPQRRGVSPWFWPARAQVLPQPLGVVGVINCI